MPSLEERLRLERRFNAVARLEEEYGLIFVSVKASRAVTTERLEDMLTCLDAGRYIEPALAPFEEGKTAKVSGAMASEWENACDALRKAAFQREAVTGRLLTAMDDAQFAAAAGVRFARRQVFRQYRTAQPSRAIPVVRLVASHGGDTGDLPEMRKALEAASA